MSLLKKIEYKITLSKAEKNFKNTFEIEKHHLIAYSFENECKTFFWGENGFLGFWCVHDEVPRQAN